MANGVDFKLNIVTDAKQLLKELEQTRKQAVKNLKKHESLKDKYERTTKQKAAAGKREAVSDFKIQKKHITELQKMHKSGRTQQQIEQRRDMRTQKAARREEKRFQKEQSRFARSERVKQFRGSRAAKVAGAGLGLAGGIAGFFTGGLVSSYSKHLQVEKSRANLIGLASGGRPGSMVGSGSRILNSLQGSNMGSALGYNKAETAQHAGMMARATGYTGPREMQQTMRATGMSAGEVSSMFGTFTKAGADFGGGQKSGSSQGANMLKKTLSIAVHTGLKRARFPEFVKGMMTLVKQQGASVAGRIDPTSSAKVLGMFAGTDIEGFKGERGAAMASKLQSAFYKPGGGEWGQGLFQRAMGFGRKGSGESYYTARKKQQRGLTKGNLSSLLGQVGTEHGFGEEGALALEKVSGLSLDYAEKLLKSYKDGTLTEKEVEKAIKKSVPIEKQALEAMKGIGETSQRLADRFDKHADVGKEHKEIVEGIQDLQLAAFQQLSAWLTEYGPVLKEMGEYVKKLAVTAMEWFGQKGITYDEAAAKKETAKEAAKRYAAATTVEEKLEAARAEVKAREGTATESFGAEYGSIKNKVLAAVVGTAGVATGSTAVMDAMGRYAAVEKDKVLRRNILGTEKTGQARTKLIRSEITSDYMKSMRPGSVLSEDLPMERKFGAEVYRDMRLTANQRIAEENMLSRKFPGRDPNVELSADMLNELRMMREWNESHPLTFSTPLAASDANTPKTTESGHQ